MAAPASSTQWYLARDGQQYGPLSDAELDKFIELGHLQPSDLLWRDGFSDWRPAMVVFPARLPGTQRSRTQPAGSAGSTPLAGGREQPSFGLEPLQPARQYPADGEKEPSGRGGLRRVLVGIILLVGLAGTIGLAYPHRTKLMEFAVALPTLAPSGIFDGPDRRSLEVAPLTGFKGSPEAIDANLQNTALWRVLKREFPDWYAERLKEFASLSRENKDDATVNQQAARVLVALRRQHADNALSASLPRLKAIAVAFYDNLVQLRKHSVEACFGFISQGEASPAVVSLLQGSEQTGYLQAQMTAVFEAIAEGRKTPRVYPRPRKEDYNVLAADLAKRGWSQADMQLFSDERALARASPGKVCQLVHDWFAAQLAIKDSEVQLRLLVDSLRPVVAG